MERDSSRFRAECVWSIRHGALRSFRRWHEWRLVDRDLQHDGPSRFEHVRDFGPEHELWASSFVVDDRHGGLLEQQRWEQQQQQQQRFQLLDREP